MKKFLTLYYLLSLLSVFLLTGQVPGGFNYQAIARGADGKEIPNAAILVKISILTDTTGFYKTGTGSYLWEEQHSVTTNSLGLFTLMVGDPAAQFIQGTSVDFDSIDWKLHPIYIGTKIRHLGVWRIMGAAGLYSVPYSLLSGKLAGPVEKLEVMANPSSGLEESLFEVKNTTGQTIFAVYNEGVRVYVDDGSKGSKGGFAIGGFGGKASQEFLRVTKDSTRIYFNQNFKGSKGGFAIGGFAGKAGADYLMDLTQKNYFIGHQSGRSNTTGLYNSFIGYQAGFSNVGGDNNVFIGFNAGYSNLDGNDNIFIGNQSGKTSDGYSNVFIGHNSGQMNHYGSYNIFIGEISGLNNVDGTSNIFMGYEAGVQNISGGDNIYIGPFCANSITAGNGNVMMGVEAGSNKTSGSENVFLGSWAGLESVTGSGNTMVGTSAGNSCLGDKNVFLGYMAGAAETGSNTLYIDNSGTSSPLIFGDFTNGAERLVVNGNLGVGVTVPTAKLDVNGTAKIGSSGSILTKIIKVTVSKDLPSINGNTSSLQAFTVANSGVTGCVSISPASDLPDGLEIAYARVSAAGTVSVKFRNVTGAAIDAPLMNWYISVIE